MRAAVREPQGAIDDDIRGDIGSITDATGLGCEKRHLCDIEGDSGATPKATGVAPIVPAQVSQGDTVGRLSSTWKALMFPGVAPHCPCLRVDT